MGRLAQDRQGRCLSRPLRVVVTGSECTGKTTLASGLARHFGAPWSPEYSRRYALATRPPLDASDVEPIARGQLTLEEAHLRRAATLLVQDTDLLSTLVYARHYYGACPEWVEESLRLRTADLYLLLDIDVPWVPDPARDRGDRREEMHALFQGALESIGARVVLISGAWDERMVRAVAAIEGLLAASN